MPKKDKNLDVPQHLNTNSPLYLGRALTPEDLKFTKEEEEAIRYIREVPKTDPKYDMKIYQKSVDILFPESKKGVKQTKLQNIWALKHGTKGLYDVVASRTLESQADPKATIPIVTGPAYLRKIFQELPESSSTPEVGRMKQRELLNQYQQETGDKGFKYNPNKENMDFIDWLNDKAQEGSAKTTGIRSILEGYRNKYVDKDNKVYLTSRHINPTSFVQSHELGHWRDTLMKTPPEADLRAAISMGDLDKVIEQGFTNEREVNLGAEAVQEWLNTRYEDFKEEVGDLENADRTSADYRSAVRNVMGEWDASLANNLGRLFELHGKAKEGTLTPTEKEAYQKGLRRTSAYGLLNRELIADTLSHTQLAGLQDKINLGQDMSPKELSTYIKSVKESPSHRNNFFVRSGMFDKLMGEKSYRKRLQNILRSYAAAKVPSTEGDLVA